MVASDAILRLKEEPARSSRGWRTALTTSLTVTWSAKSRTIRTFVFFFKNVFKFFLVESCFFNS